MSKHKRKIVVVTGASAGLGRAVAVGFGRQGYDVALIARGEINLTAAADAVAATGAHALIVPCDVSDASALQAAADRIERQLGPIDIWVNSAMVTVYAPSWQIEPSEFEQVTKVTYLGQVFGAQAALTHMRRRKRGTIVFVNSALGYRSIPFQAPYCAAKAAVRGFVDSLRSELRWEGNKNIRLTTVYLPAVNTPQFEWARNKLDRHAAPLPPIYQPAIVADAIIKAALSQSREVWLGNSTLKAIIGQTLAPGLVDFILALKGPKAETIDQPNTANRPDNLFSAGASPAAARGRFDDQAETDLAYFTPSWLRAGIFGAALTLTTGFALSMIGNITRPRRK